MPRLETQLQRQGEWLFRWRSYLPLLSVPLFATFFMHFHELSRSHRNTDVWEMACFGLAMAGLIMRILTVGFVPDGTSGRNTRRLKGDHLNTTGMYSIVRHPLYVANFLIWMGVVLFARDWGGVMIAAIAYWLYYERIILAEEAFLAQRHEARFAEWSARTPALIPRLGNWTAPEFGFCWRAALRREYTTLFGIVVVFTAFEIIGRWKMTGVFGIDPVWIGVFLGVLPVYLTVRTLKKRTRVLHGRPR